METETTELESNEIEKDLKDDELSILKETLAKRDGELAEHKARMEQHYREMSALRDEISKLKNELAEAHELFKNDDVSKKEKTLKDNIKEWTD